MRSFPKIRPAHPPLSRPIDRSSTRLLQVTRNTGRIEPEPGIDTLSPTLAGRRFWCVGRCGPAASLQEVGSGVVRANRRSGETSSCASSQETAAMASNITQDHRRAFEALTGGEVGNFCLFSCFVSGWPGPCRRPRSTRSSILRKSQASTPPNDNPRRTLETLRSQDALSEQLSSTTVD